MMRLLRPILVVGIACACRGQREPADDGHAAVLPPTLITADAAPAIDPARACGEPGPSATPLPPRLFDGMASMGDGAVKPDETTHVGGVEAKYGASVWIGTMEHGHRGPALALLIDRAEASGGPWGASVPLAAKTTNRTFIGPYRIDVVASDESPPQHVQVHVEHRACPDHFVTPPSTGPMWMWASSEAIRLVTVDLPGQLLQVVVDSNAAGPRLEVSSLGWHQALVPVPGMTTTVRADQRTVTIEAVEPGRGTHFDGTAWHADAGTPKLSVRARVDNVDPIPIASADVPAAPCGDPIAKRSTLPAELKVVPRVHGTTTIATGQHRSLDGIELDASTMSTPRRHGEAQSSYLTVSSPSLVPSMVNSNFSSMELARAERAVVVFEPVGTPAASFRVRSFPVACPRDLALPAPDAPVYVWLSSVGHDSIMFGPPDKPSLSLRLYVDATTTFGATSPNAYDSRAVDPGLVGHVATLDGLFVQVTDVVATTDTRVPFPLTHVQVRVSRPGAPP
ncbi:MAG TPA: hypothetical protein VGO00_28170 [Kofleriaceae bacterium]|jgi:hypothetical protein|nr:hypothetical protein [Kofleriaceae bacterium]